MRILRVVLTGRPLISTEKKSRVILTSADSSMGQTDILRVTDLYLESLPEDLLPTLGRDYVECLMKFLIQSDEEKIFLLRNDQEEIQAVCIISLSMPTFMKRTIKYTFAHFMKAFFRNFFSSLKFQKMTFSIIKCFFLRNQPAFNPEIICIFSDATNRGQGMGSQLLLCAEEYLKERHFNTLYARTASDEANRAVSFYTNNGFQYDKKIKFGLRKFSVLKKYF